MGQLWRQPAADLSPLARGPFIDAAIMRPDGRR
jgi:hypothetical protein